MNATMSAGHDNARSAARSLHETRVIRVEKHVLQQRRLSIWIQEYEGLRAHNTLRRSRDAHVSEQRSRYRREERRFFGRDAKR